jgi:hypothetical protein
LLDSGGVSDVSRFDCGGGQRGESASGVVQCQRALDSRGIFAGRRLFDLEDRWGNLEY